MSRKRPFVGRLGEKISPNHLERNMNAHYFIAAQFFLRVNMAKARKPTKAHLSRAARDMHDRNPEVRKDAAEVMAVAPRKKSTSRRGR